MKKLPLRLVLAVALIPFYCAAEDKPIVNIGVIIPLTGDMAQHGVEIQRSMKMAMERYSSQRHHYSYGFIFEDNQLDSTKSVSAAQKLINLTKADVIVTLWPPTANAVLPLTEKAGVLHYTIAWDPNLARNNKLLLSHQAMVDEIARSTLRLLRHEGKVHVAFFHLEEAGFNLGAYFIKQLAPSEGITLIADESFNPGETDFKSLIERVSKKSPDSYLIWSVMPSLDILIHQIRVLSPKAYITGYLDYAQDTKQIQNTPYISEMFASDDFSQNYKERFGSEPTSKGANAFDITKLLVSAFESYPSRKPTAAELKSYLTKIHDYPGAVGKFSIDDFGNSSYPPVIREVNNNQRVLVSINLEDNKSLEMTH